MGTKNFHVTKEKEEDGEDSGGKRMKGRLAAQESEVKEKGRSTLISGKIDLLSAQKYALHAERFSKVDHVDKHEQSVAAKGIRPEGEDGKETGGTNENDDPTLIVEALGEIKIETLSWMDVIKRRHGFL